MINLGGRDLFVAGLDSVEDIGCGCLRFTFFRERNGQREIVEEVSIVMHCSAVPDAMGKTVEETGICACAHFAKMTLN